MAGPTFKNVTHCIFDMDGLLIDSENKYTEIFNCVTQKFGKTYTWEHKIKTMGSLPQEATKQIIKLLDLPLEPQEFDELFNENKHLFATCQFMPDSERVYKQIYDSIVSKYGHKYGGRVAFEVLGRPERVGAELIIEHYKLPLAIDDFQEIYRRLQRELFHDIKMMPGAERLLRHLKENNVPIALATSSSQESYNLKTSHLQHVFELFHHQVKGGSDPDVKKGKPNPDIFLVAASRFPDNPDPSQCLVFEDAPNGVLAGLSAGMQVVMVPDPNVPDDFINENVTLRLSSLEEFKPELFGLPPFKN